MEELFRGKLRTDQNCYGELNVKSKIFLFGQKIYEWLSKFAPTYRGVLPAGTSPEKDVYLRMDGYYDTFATSFIFPVQIYAQKTTSYSSVLLIADEIANAVGDGGILMSGDGIKFRIMKGSPFYQDRADEDETVRAGYVNLEITVY